MATALTFLPDTATLGIPDDEAGWLSLLGARMHAEAPDLLRLDAYYEGRQPLSYMHPDLLREIGDRVRQVVINWPRLCVDTVEERLDVEGFRLAAGAEADEDLWLRWQLAGLDEASQWAHLDALIFGRSYAVVGARDNGSPLVSVESPTQVIADHDPRTREVRAAAKRYTDGGTTRATLYLPDVTVWYARDDTGNGEWRTVDRDEHELGVVPVVPFINRRRTLGVEGTSDLADVTDLADLANKTATDMGVAGEFHAVPQRWVFGMNRDDFVDPTTGRPLSTWQAIMGRVWASENADAKAGQFDQSDMSNFHSTIRLLAERVAELTGMPPHYLGTRSENPTSADAIRSSEARLVRRTERKQKAFGAAWKRVQALITRIADGEWDPAMVTAETLWADAATPTLAQKSDAAAKLVESGIIPVPFAREILGFSAPTRMRMDEMDSQATTRVLGGDVSSLLTGEKPGAR